jgi:hypothetical protein
MRSQLHLLALLLVSLFIHNVVLAKGSDRNKGIIPAAPPVNVFTSDTNIDYTGYGYLQFDVTLPGSVTPEFTLGSNEDASWDTGDNRFSSKGLVYVHEGKLRKTKSVEKAWIAGLIEGKADSNSFVRNGVRFINKYERSGFYVGSRNTVSKQLSHTSLYVLDYSFTSMWAAFTLSGNTRIASSSGSGTYISDFDGSSYGFLYRPVVTIQPVFTLSNSIKFIPFVGASSFLSLDYSYWELNEWEDALYGTDCFDGCPDDDLFFNFIPIETFAGFDVEFYFGKTDSISLSAFFSAGITTDTDSMSEIYIIYSRRYN